MDVVSGEGYAQSPPAAVWLGEESRSQTWYEESVHHALKLTAINPAIAHYWQGKALESVDWVSFLNPCALS